MTNATATSEKETNQVTGNPFEQTVPVSLTIRMLGVSKKVKTEKSNGNAPSPKEAGGAPTLEVTTDTDLESVKVSKKLLDCEEYQAIQSLAGEIRTFLRRKSVPGGGKIFRSGTYPVPIRILTDVDETLKEYEERFKLLVKQFCEVYELRKSEAIVRLRDLGNEGDYPPIKKVRASFGIEYEYVSFGPPSSLAGISRQLYEREVKKVQENCRMAADNVTLALRSMMQDLLESMVERLKPEKGGKKKIFKNTLVTNMKEFMADFKDRNITNDAELEEVVKKVGAVLEGKDAEVLRKDDFVRSQTANALEEVKKRLDGMVEDVKSRRIDLED